MRKALLALCCVLLLASFANDTSNKTILKDIDGTLLQSYVVIDYDANTVTFTVDANTTVNSTIIDAEIKIFLVQNTNSGKNLSHTLTFEEVGNLSFDHYMKANYDVASNEVMLGSAAVLLKHKPHVIK